MKKRELSKILNFVLNEELNLAKENIMRVLKEETDKHKDKIISKLEAEKDTIDADEAYNLSEKEADINAIAGQQAADDVESNNLDFTDPTIAASVDTSEVDPNEVNYKLNDVRLDIDDLKKKFDELMSSKPTTEPEDKEVTDPEESNFDDITEETLENDLTDEDKDGDLAEDNKTINEESDYGLENLLAEDIFSSIMEEYEGTKVSNPVNKDGELVGDGDKVSQNDKSPLSVNNETFSDLETSAEPIEIKNSGSPKGFDREKSPEVHGNGITPINAPNIKEVPEGGDKSAIINSKNGFGGDDSKSPIPGK